MARPWSRSLPHRRWRLAVVGGALFSAVALRAADAPPLRHERMGVANGCFVESVALLDELAESRGADAWSRLLRWGARKDDEEVTGHAVAVCDAGGSLWCWDINFGWKQLPAPEAQRDQVAAISPAITARYPEISPEYPELLEEFAQAPDPAPPAVVDLAENRAAHDASLAASVLGRHRAVNAVLFAYGVDGADYPSAAVIFEYNGRMFVYAPDRGTFASRARGSVHNVRLVAEMLRRLFPGARAIRPITAS